MFLFDDVIMVNETPISEYLHCDPMLCILCRDIEYNIKTTICLANQKPVLSILW